MKQAANLLLLIFISIFSLKSHAQIIPVKGVFQTDLARVLEDYPNNFKNILGDLIAENPQTADYESKHKVRDAMETRLTRYSAEGKEIWSWEALMLRTESFEKAEKKFRSLFQSINNLSVNGGHGKTVFKGSFEKPVEERNFTSILFRPGQDNGVMKKIRIDLSMQNEMLEWVVRVIIYDVEREAHEKGDSLERRPF